MAPKVALIFGYGPRVGAPLAKTLKSSGYRVAIVSRSAKDPSEVGDYMQVQADLTRPSTVADTFNKVIKTLGHPSVVIYNAGAGMMNPLNSLERQISDFQAENNVNIVSPYVAAHLATKSFATLPSDASKTFIYTGNKQPFLVVRPLLTGGVGKSGAAHMIHYLAGEFQDKGYKFYYADERLPNGDPVYGAIDGSAHAEYYTELIKGKTQGPWNATFVKGRGYVAFPNTVVEESVVMNFELPRE